MADRSLRFPFARGDAAPASDSQPAGAAERAASARAALRALGRGLRGWARCSWRRWR